MSQSRNLLISGYSGQPLHLAQYRPVDHGSYHEPERSGVVVRNLDDIGHAVDVGHVPDFWKPCEDWTLD
ncbi:hypothetical protein [Sulfuritalea sp.]|uniref:hypothetical protein n=1 Tax=Sulfuritalea sp. TaxID=2480090 RepID=UPI001ACD3617|nr:hypothetical protein [Sulfuritalea sp.]MBN8476297.1 hypothetical protein [Sulfuritalea sp.]